MSSVPILVSVVVIGRNEGARLTRCLESVRATRGYSDQIELIYVDSGSSDDSVSRAQACGTQTLGLDGARPCAAAGRNIGWRAANGKYVLFLDGDTILHPDFLNTALRAMDDAQVGVVWGHRREIHPEQSLYNRVLDLDWIYPAGDSEFCGGDALMRRAILEAAGGYDATLIAGEEPELCRRLRLAGWRICHIDQPMTGHDLAMTHFAQYWKRAYRSGYAYAEIAARFRDTAMPLWQDEARRNIRRGSILLLLFPLAFILAVALANVAPLALALAFVAALILRSAQGAKRKGAFSFATRIAYGLHSHFQQIPIMLGQLAHRRHGRRGLIEYK